jgi:hypothetical protein
MTKDKAKLEEVKAILHELQRIRPDLASLDKAAQPQPVRPTVSPVVNGAERVRPVHEHVAATNPASAPQRPDATASAGGTNRRALVVGAGFLVVASAAVGALFILNQHQPPKPTKAPDQVAAISPAAAPAPSPVSPAPSENPQAADSKLALLQQGQKLMSEGDIKGAREALLQPAESGYPDAAFSLARSYDPNFLQSVTNPNAAPDVAQAEIWYRRWHEAAVKAGVVTDSLRLERILQSMH